VGPDASLADASAPLPGSAKERRFESDGQGAWGAADRRPAPSRATGARAAAASEPALRAAFSDAWAGSKAASGEALGAPEEGFGHDFAALGMGFGRAFESCPIREAYRTFLFPDTCGGLGRFPWPYAPPMPRLPSWPW
jgi:hypothetical protein